MKKQVFLTKDYVDDPNGHVFVRFATVPDDYVIVADQKFCPITKAVFSLGEEPSEYRETLETVFRVFAETDNDPISRFVAFAGETGEEILSAIVDICFCQGEYLPRSSSH